jgi:hypothetical protein
MQETPRLLLFFSNIVEFLDAVDVIESRGEGS